MSGCDVGVLSAYPALGRCIVVFGSIFKLTEVHWGIAPVLDCTRMRPR